METVVWNRCTNPFFANAATFEKYRKTTRREKFLAPAEQIVPWIFCAFLLNPSIQSLERGAQQFTCCLRYPTCARKNLLTAWGVVSPETGQEAEKAAKTEPKGIWGPETNLKRSTMHRVVHRKRILLLKSRCCGFQPILFRDSFEFPSYVLRTTGFF